MVSKEHKIILLVPPKTGSNSIKKCFESAGVVFELPSKTLNFPIYHSTLSEILIAYEISKDELNDYKIIQIVRNPYERFVSGWIHQNEIIGFETNIKQFTEKLKKYKYLLKDDYNNFYIDFYGSLNYRDKFFKNNNWGGLRFWWEQNWWNDLNAKIKFFKLEILKDDINELVEYVKLPLHKLEVIRPNLQKKKLFNYTEQIDIVKDSIKEMYKNDFKLYNYEF